VDVAQQLPSPSSFTLAPLLNNKRSSMIGVPLYRRYDGMRRDQSL
jgi:hypothetical protein